MKNIKKIMITLVLTAAVVISLSGCTMRVSVNYDNADKYTPGDREITETIRNLDIDYSEGNVSVVSGNSDIVFVKETTNKKIEDKLKVHTWVEGDTLHVKYCAAAKNLSFNNLQKSLEITVPEKAKLDDVVIDASEGDVDVSCSAKDYNIDASEGNVNLTQNGESNSMVIDASEGNVKVDAQKVKEFEVDASEGNCELRFAEAPAKTSVDASEGDVTLYLPDNSDITAELNISEGDFNSELPFIKKGDKYICGNGTNKMMIDASEGNVNVKKYN